MYRVLIADDEPIEIAIVSKIIQKNFSDGMEIVQAVNGREAIEKFLEKRCQVVLLDVEMPGINGLEAAERIRKEDKTCSIIFLTAFDEFTYAKKAITVKALDYLLKPVSDDELIAVIDEAIRLIKLDIKSSLPEGDFNNEMFGIESGKTEHVRMNVVQEMIMDYISNHYTEDISLQDVA